MNTDKTERSETLADDERSRFINYVKYSHPDLRTSFYSDALEFMSGTVQSMWVGWQAARSQTSSIPAASSSAAPSVPDAWMKATSTETTSHAHKMWMENAGFGVWADVAAQYTRPLYFAAPAASPAVLTDADIERIWGEQLRLDPLPQPAYKHLARAIERHITGQTGGVAAQGGE